MILGALVAAADARATLPGANGKIVFASWGEIYTVNPDGSGLAQVQRSDEDEKRDWYPAWSPDGTRIATTGEVLEPLRDYLPYRLWSGNDIHVFGADGSGFMHFATPRQHYSGDVTCSPGGTRIAYTSDKVGNGSIYIVRADGSDPQAILVGESGSGALHPAWSPDGKWIAIARGVGNYETDLYLIRPDGTGLHKLLERPGTETGPSWSPDGTTIVFSGSERRAGETGERESIFTVSAGGDELTRLTTGDHEADAPLNVARRVIVCIAPTPAVDLLHELRDRWSSQTRTPHPGTRLPFHARRAPLRGRASLLVVVHCDSVAGVGGAIASASLRSDGAQAASDRELARVEIVPRHRMHRIRPSGASVARPERARRGGRREAPRSRGSTSLKATLLKLHRTAAFSAVLAANRNAASDLLHPAVGEEQGRDLSAPVRGRSHGGACDHVRGGMHRDQA